MVLYSVVSSRAQPAGHCRVILEDKYFSGGCLLRNMAISMHEMVQHSV
jgi:hypothetical protein